MTDKQIRAVNSNKNGFYNDYKTSHDNADKYLGAEAIEGDRRPDEDLKDGDTEYISAVVSVEESSRGEQDLIFTFVPYTIEKNQTVYDADKNPVSAGDKIIGWFACDFTMEQIDWKEEKSIQEESTVAEETEKTAEIILAHEDKDREIREISHTLRLAEQPQEEDKKEEAAPSAEEFKAGSLTARGADYTVTLDYSEEAQIPENAELTVREITQKSNKEIYEDCLAQAEDHVAESGENQSGVDAAATRFFDIEIVIKDEDGTEHKVEPASPVNVSILIQDAAADERTSAESYIKNYVRKCILSNLAGKRKNIK